jgi:hypothetical protein
MSLSGRFRRAAQAFNEDDKAKDITTPWSRKGEEAMLAVIMSEIESGQRRQGIWAKALMDSDGDNDRAESLYIKYAVQSLIDDNIIEVVELDQREKEELDQREKDTKASIRRGRIYIFWIFIIIIAVWIFNQN